MKPQRYYLSPELLEPRDFADERVPRSWEI
jgi:hypothetical protein